MEPIDHDTLLVRRGARSGLVTIVAVHSVTLGPSLGGCRLWSYDTPDDAVDDALRLSRAMTYKAAAAGLPQGGGKGVIMLPDRRPLEGERRRAALLDFADTVDLLGGRYVTAEDVGISDADMAVIAEGTRHVTGLPVERGGSGDPSPWTAIGVEVSIRVACERVWGTDSLEGRTVSVIGLGHVGAALARLLAGAGARLVVSDVVEERRAIADELGAQWVTPDEALSANVDIVAPCALGGVLNADSVPRLQARVVAGAANNQLADDAVADLLHERGILWVPDFVANAGGIVNIAVELLPPGYSAERAERDVRRIADTVRDVLDDAARDGITPLAAAMALAVSRLEAAEPEANVAA